MRISDWSSDVCSSDLPCKDRAVYEKAGHGEPVLTLCLRSACGGAARNPDGLACHHLLHAVGDDLLAGSQSFEDHPFVALHFAQPDRARHGVALFIDNENRSEEHTSELQSLMRNSYSVFCLKKKTSSHSTNSHLRNPVRP